MATLNKHPHHFAIPGKPIREFVCACIFPPLSKLPSEKTRYGVFEHGFGRERLRDLSTARLSPICKCHWGIW
ncbi:hypothetical protein E2C01_070112 [Portunus trituberculatus]|uniref:Uncharacterized protein n=1 Tax=Portunus trituberculatus TaxID=210409 RepID=A0A5B7I1D6_PORTR|nr:hypothetical protein [Portunus trituberculatus]